MFHSDLHLLLGPGILTTEGEQHRRQRKLLNPVFSAAHLRNMTHIFYNVAHDVCMTVRDANSSLKTRFRSLKLLGNVFPRALWQKSLT